MKVERETVTIIQAAAMVGVSRRTIYNWINARKVQTVRTAGGSYRIFADTLYRESADDEQPVDRPVARVS